MDNQNLIEFKLNTQQQEAYNAIASGLSVFLTGSAGTGKTELIKYIYQLKKDTNQSVALTGMTGVSAVLIGGTTLHSYLGIGLGTNSTEKLVSKIRNSFFYRSRFSNKSI